MKLRVRKEPAWRSSPWDWGGCWVSRAQSQRKRSSLERRDLTRPKITADGDCSHEIKRRYSLEEKLWPTYIAYWKAETLLCQGYGFSSGHVWMWELDYEEGWALKNWCFRTVVLEKTLESPLDCKEIQPVHPKGNQSWKFIGRTDAESETPILWPPDAKKCCCCCC